MRFMNEMRLKLSFAEVCVSAWLSARFSCMTVAGRGQELARITNASCVKDMCAPSPAAQKQLYAELVSVLLGDVPRCWWSVVLTSVPLSCAQAWLLRHDCIVPIESRLLLVLPGHLKRVESTPAMQRTSYVARACARGPLSLAAAAAAAAAAAVAVAAAAAAAAAAAVVVE